MRPTNGQTTHSKFILIFNTRFRFRSIVASYQRMYPDYDVDVDAELEKYVFIKRFMRFDNVTLSNFRIFIALRCPSDTKATRKNCVQWWKIPSRCCTPKSMRVARFSSRAPMLPCWTLISVSFEQISNFLFSFSEYSRTIRHNNLKNVQQVHTRM